ncbi:MAG: hypothetical protein GYB67_01710 [Chloroflexi bacterium]|nr:hypothetical protein [Chloroflexota bacterium]
MSVPETLKRQLIEALAKHLPPSAAALRLIDVGGATGAVLADVRGDLDIRAFEADDLGGFPAESADAVAVYDQPLGPSLLTAALNALRPGGRLIAVTASGAPSAAQVAALESVGYTRILVEAAVETGQPGAVVGVLARGEKPHQTDDTLARVRGVADRDSDEMALLPRLFADHDDFSGRYVHLLIQQTPNKPVWALAPGEPVAWSALALTLDDHATALIAFSSLPKAVAFMQPAVVNGQVRDVNKVGKFSRATAHTWTLPVLINPPLSALAAGVIGWVTIDAATAEAPDE